MSQPIESPFAQGQILLLSTEEQNYAFDLWETFRIALGRHHTNDIPLGSRKVSNYHAEILNEPEGLRIRDMGSTNGTFVNDEKIRSRAIREGDVIRIGGYALTVHFENRNEGSQKGGNLLPLGSKGKIVALRANKQGADPVRSSEGLATTLPDLMKIIANGKVSALLIIKRQGGDEGRVYADKGRIYRAEIGRVKGEKALYRLFRWSDATFEVAAPPDASSSPHSIDLPMESLIKEGLHHLEEIEMITPLLPPPAMPLRLKEDCPLPIRELSPAEIEIFQEIIRHETIAQVLEQSPLTDLKILTLVVSLFRKKVFTVAESSSALLEETFILRSQ